MSRNRRSPFAIKLAPALLLICSQAYAQTPESRTSSQNGWGATLGVSGDIGVMGSDDRGIVDRTMATYSIEALPGYRFGGLLVGLDIDYRWVEQITALANAGNANWQGQSWWLGVGLNYSLNESWSIQAALDFLGDYKFKNKTAAGEDDHLSQPIAIRFKPQFFAFGGVPLSLDLDLQYFMFNKFHIGSQEYSQVSNGYFAGVGLTWHFGKGGGSVAAPEPAPAQPAQPVVAAPAAAPEIVPEAPPAPTQAEQLLARQQEELAKVVDVKRTENGLMVNLKGDVSFASGSAKLSSQAQELVQKTAVILAQNPNAKVRIEGHTDSSGQKAKNQKLSQARAESVRDVLTKNGLKAENVTATGLGDTKPVADNKAPEGRSQNRRVEIYLEE